MWQPLLPTGLPSFRRRPLLRFADIAVRGSIGDARARGKPSTSFDSPEAVEKELRVLDVEYLDG